MQFLGRTGERERTQQLACMPHMCLAWGHTVPQPLPGVALEGPATVIQVILSTAGPDQYLILGPLKLLAHLANIIGVGGGNSWAS